MNYTMWYLLVLLCRGDSYERPKWVVLCNGIENVLSTHQVLSLSSEPLQCCVYVSVLKI